MPRKTNFSVNGNDYFRVTATIGKNADGKPIRKQFLGKSKKEAENKRDEFLQGLKAGLSVGFEKTLFGIAFRSWLVDIHRPSIRQTTYRKYETLHRLYIDDSLLAGMRLRDVQPENVQIFVNGLVAKTTIQNTYEVFKLVKTFTTYCLEVDALVKSPLRGVKLPKKPEKATKNVALSDADIDKLIAACEKEIKYFPYLFIAFSGLRSSEARALTLGDIKDGMINVNKQIQFLNIDGDYKPVVTPPKTRAGTRRVPIADIIKPLLQAHINTLTDNGKIIILNSENALLFPSMTGGYKEQNNFLNSYQRLCDKLDIRQGRTVHSLRHTFITLLAKSDVSLLDASRLAGHENISVTAEIYSHVSDEDKINAVKKLSARYS